MKTLFIIGDDKIGRATINSVGLSDHVWLNRSTSFGRVLKLVQKRIITIGEIMQMVMADQLRKDFKVPDFPIIRTNQDLIKVLEVQKPDRVICFRAGLVLGRAVLDYDIQFLNIHCADLPDFGGLGSIPRALKAGAYAQNACLHEMQVRIDSGRVLYREPYQLSQHHSFKTNEDVAYGAGQKILKKIITNEIST